MRAGHHGRLFPAPLCPQSWEDVYFFCGARYQHCTAGFRWNGGWVGARAGWHCCFPGRGLFCTAGCLLGCSRWLDLPPPLLNSRPRLSLPWPLPVVTRSGWMQAFVLGNFVLSSALLLQKLMVALGLGGLLPGERPLRSAGRRRCCSAAAAARPALLLSQRGTARGGGGCCRRQACASACRTFLSMLPPRPGCSPGLPPNPPTNFNATSTQCKQGRR